MPTPSNILLYGHDLAVLESRRLLLGAFGHRVWIATHCRDVQSFAPLADLDLIIFCHSLSMEERGCAVSFAQSRWPHVKGLALTAGSDGCGAPSWCEQHDAIDGPAKLLSTVSRLVAAENTTYAYH